MAIETKNFEQFIFREDNREKISNKHVNALVESIRSCNLLDIRPIVVNERMEIIDGQHRVLAAMKLGVPIFYTIEDKRSPKDIVLLSITKAWGYADFLNFYVKNGYEEYIRLKDFIKFNDVVLSVALTLIMGKTDKAYKKFKSGEFVMNTNLSSKEFQLCRQTQDMIRKNQGSQDYVNATKFWQAHLALTKMQKFDADRWNINAERLSDRFCIKATSAGYLALFVCIYNWHTKNIDKLFINNEHNNPHITEVE